MTITDAREHDPTRLNRCAGGISRCGQENGAGRTGGTAKPFDAAPARKTPAFGLFAADARFVASLDRTPGTLVGTLLPDRIAANRRS